MSEKLDQVLAAFSNQSQLLADICVGHRSATVYSTNFRHVHVYLMWCMYMCCVCMFSLFPFQSLFSAQHNNNTPCVYIYIITEDVHRYYESRRRWFNGDQPGRLHIAQEMRKKSKNNAHRKLVCSLHSSAIFLCSVPIGCIIRYVYINFYLNCRMQLYERRKRALKRTKNERDGRQLRRVMARMK